MDCSLPGSSVYGIFQARVLEWVAIFFSRGSSWPRNWTWVACIADRFITDWATREALRCQIFLIWLQFSSVQLSSVRLFETQWTAACQASLSIINSRSLFKLTSIELVMPSNHLILCHPLLQPSIFPSIRIFSNESALHKWPKYWSFSFNISPSNEYLGLVSFRIDWFDLLAVQGTLKSLFQQHSSKASILWHSVFFIVQLSHPYMTTAKTIALTRRTFVGFLHWEIFITDSIPLLVNGLFRFLFLSNSVSVNYTFTIIPPFFLGWLVCWCIVFHSSLLWSIEFLWH